MKIINQKITPSLWFEKDAEKAVKFYTSIFKNSKILRTTKYNADSAKVSGQKEGSVLTIEFVLDGQKFLALNGGPLYKFSPATSFIVNCHTQQEVDYFWEKLSKGGKKSVCGWIERDKFGVTWQVVPTILDELLSDKDKAKSDRVMAAMLKMKKIDIKGLMKAYGSTITKKGG